MDVALAQVIGSAVGGGGIAGAIIWGLLKVTARQYEAARRERDARVDDELRRLRDRGHQFANILQELKLAVEKKNGSDLKLIDQRLQRMETRADADHQRLGKLEDEQIRLMARRGE